MSQPSVEPAPIPASSSTGSAKATKWGTLTLAGIAGAFASACCIGPLVLASLGLGSIAASIVAMFEPLRPVFVAIALAALGFAGWKIYRRPITVCEPGTARDLPQAGRTYKIVFWIVAIIVLALLASPYYISLIY